MYHKGVNRELVIQTAVELAEKNGLNSFSMHQLAEALGIRTASLYKHVSGLDEVITELGRYALKLQRDEELKAIEGLHGDEAVFAFASAYRRFAQMHPELYRTILSMQHMSNDALEKETVVLADTVMYVLKDYDLDEIELMHWQRILRSIMHGFITHEEAGYFIHFAADKEDTYRLAIQCFLDGLKGRKRGNATEDRREKTEEE